MNILKKIPLIISITALFFCLSCEKPEREAKVETGQVTEIMTTGAKVAGEIIDLGEGITEHGHCWGFGSQPTLSDLKTILGSAEKTGSFNSILQNLEVGQKYYVRAYANTKGEVIYGSSQQFITGNGIPQLTTLSVTNIKVDSATSGGNITSDGGATVTARGVCWNTTGSPALEDNNGFTNDGNGMGSFFSQLNGLTINTTYFVRAYATTDYGTSYGEEKSFLTKGLPEVTTSEVSDITDTSAVCGGEVTNDWGLPVTVQGVCWNSEGNPTLENNLGYTNDGSGIGSFISDLTGLSEGTTYYISAYATNSVGTANGLVKTFIPIYQCGIQTIADYDGNIYLTVKIGNQCWMKENLKTTHYCDGTLLVDGTGIGSISGDFTTKYFLVYNDNKANKDTYGLLYTWVAAMNSAVSSNDNPSGVQGVCPTGWHLPSKIEWIELEDYLGGPALAGGKMKESGYEHWSTPNTGATNESGFSGLPGGCYNSGGIFQEIGTGGYWWSATEDNTENAYEHNLLYNEVGVGFPPDLKTWGFSVRCVRDK